MKFRTALVAASIMALPVAAMAQPVEGLYVGAGVGVNYLFSQNIVDPPGAGNLNGAAGVVTLGSIGWGFGGGLRAEGEFNFRSTAQSGNAGKDRNETYGVFGNVLYDIDVGSTDFFPYVGVGIGWLNQNVTGGNITGSYTFSGNSSTIAGQGILGMAVPVPDLPGLSLTAEARYVGEFQEGRYSNQVKLAAAHNVSFLAGVRYAFNVAPPPPPPPVVAPAPAPAKTYLVFFDWDKYDLTPRAKQIIAEAAANSTKVQVTRIEVNGYADTSGSPAYNLKLSVRRANAVAAELVKNGVPEKEIVTKGFGDTVLLVPTGPGVREPQNRRVEIIFK